LQELKRRLFGRGTDSAETIEIRLKNAVGEIQECIAQWKMIQYRVVNDDLARASNAFLGTIETLYSSELGLD
jgi:guanylate kinase